MRLIFKALLVLACLLPTFPAAGADFRNPEFIRIQRNENREPLALQTVVAKYVPASVRKVSKSIWSPSFTSAREPTMSS